MQNMDQTQLLVVRVTEALSRLTSIEQKQDTILEKLEELGKGQTKKGSKKKGDKADAEAVNESIDETIKEATG